MTRCPDPPAPRSAAGRKAWQPVSSVLPPQEDHSCRRMEAWTTSLIQHSSGGHSSSGPHGVTQVVMVSAAASSRPCIDARGPSSMDILLLELCFNLPFAGIGYVLCQNHLQGTGSRFSDSTLVGDGLRGHHQTDQHVFTTNTRANIIFFSVTPASHAPARMSGSPRPWRQSSPCWQAGQGGSPYPLPRRCKQISHRLPLLIVEGKLHIPNICLEGIRSSPPH